MKKKIAQTRILKPSITNKRFGVRYKDTDGSWKTKWVSNKKFKTHKERLRQAIRDKEVIEACLEKGISYQDYKSPSIIDCLMKSIRGKGLKDKSIKTYDSKIHKLHKWLISSKRNELELIEFDKLDAKAYRDYLISEYENKVTLNNHLNSMIILFGNLEDDELIDVNPFKKIKKLRAFKKGPKYIFKDDKENILQILKENNSWLYYYHLFIYLMLLRPSEIIKIKIGDIKLNERIIYIPLENVKTSRQKYPVIPDSLLPILIKVANYRYDYYLFGKGLKPNVEPFKEAYYVGKIFRKLMNKFEVDPSIKSYHFKHTGIQDYGNAGAPPKLIANQAGITLKTLDIYMETNLNHTNSSQIASKAPRIPTERKFKSLKPVNDIMMLIADLSDIEKNVLFEKLKRNQNFAY